MKAKDRITETVPDRIQRYAVVATRPYRVIRGNRGGEIGLILLVAMVAIAIIGPEIAPYGALENGHKRHGCRRLDGGAVS